MPSSDTPPRPPSAAAGHATRIKEVRRLRGRTQEAVAEELGVNYRHLQKIEGGKADFKLTTVARLASLFKIEPCFLVNTSASGLFKSLALPCQSLMLDSLPVGCLMIDAEGTTLYRNRRATELLDGARALDASGKILSGLLERLQAQGNELRENEAPRKWREDLRGAGATLGLGVEAQAMPAREGVRKTLFLLESDAPFEARPISLSRFPWENFLEVPAQNVRSVRRSKKMTQSQAAAALDMNLRYYQKIESGKLDLKRSTLAKVADTFGVQPCQLLVDKGLRPACSACFTCVAGILDRLPYGVIALGPRGELGYANAAYFRLIGRTFDPAKHQSYLDLLDEPAERERALTFLNTIFRERSTPEPYRRDLVRDDGTKIRLVNQWSYLIAEDNRLLGGVGLARAEA